MTCEKIREQLTAYLDGELEGDRGTPVRGHLRTCEACRQCATDEAALRDGLRALPPLDPPASMWAGIQAQLAAAEVRESQRPAWKRALSRWAPLAPRFGMALGACAAATVLLVWHAHHHDDAPQTVASQTPVVPPAPAPAPPPPSVVAPAGDVSADLAAEPARISGDSAQAAAALLATARSEIAAQPADRKQAFEARVTELQAAADAAADGRPKKRAYRDLIRYLQAAAIGEEVALR